MGSYRYSPRGDCGLQLTYQGTGQGAVPNMATNFDYTKITVPRLYLAQVP